MATLQEQIDAYEPKGDWTELKVLVRRIMKEKSGALRAKSALRLVERFPDTYAGGVFHTLRHGLEAIKGYEKHLVASVQRTPAVLTVMMVNAIVNDGTKKVGAVNLLSLLTKVARDESAPDDARSDARGYLKRHGVKIPPAKKKPTSAVRSAKNSASVEELVKVLGKKYDGKEIAALAKMLNEKGKVTGRDEDGGFLGFVKSGFSLSFGVDGKLDTLNAPPGFRDKESSTATLPGGLQFADSRVAVRKKLGKPKGSTKFKEGISYLTGSPATDSFAWGKLHLTITYAPDVSRITSIQVS